MNRTRLSCLGIAGGLSFANSLNRGRTWNGAWRILLGAPGFPDATV